MHRMTPITFWFDFSSPCGYLMAGHIDALAATHGRTVQWRPMLRQLEIPVPTAHAAQRDEVAQQRIFGSAFVQIDGEPFFGADRLPQSEARLSGRLAPAQQE